jgi:hypothetical protein
MSDPTPSRFDQGLERAEKFANILLPLVIAVAGGLYSYTKDQGDEKMRVQQAAQDLSQKQYANLTALLPLLLSKDPASVSAALNVYIEETKVGQAPESLKGVILNIQQTQPEHRAEAQAAVQGVERQSTGQCRSIPSGFFIQVANSVEQLKNGQALAASLKSTPGLPPIQGVQRVDAVLEQSQLRYYSNSANDKQAKLIIASLQMHGFQNVQLQDLTRAYLTVGCPPPPTFELWVGSQTPLGPDGDVHGSPPTSQRPKGEHIVIR